MLASCISAFQVYYCTRQPMTAWVPAWNDFQQLSHQLHAVTYGSLQATGSTMQAYYSIKLCCTLARIHE
jgi:hypothetical protein